MQQFWWGFLIISLVELLIIIGLVKKHKTNDGIPDKQQEVGIDLKSSCNESIVHLMKIYRHDWLNHVQVILGYVSLKKCEKIKDYMDRVYETVKQDSTISNFKDKNLAAYLYLFPIQYPNLDIQLEVGENVNETMNQTDGKWVLSYLKEFINILASNDKNHEQISPLYLSITHNNQYIMVTIEYEGEVSSIITKINQIGEQLAKEQGYFSVDLHTSNEFIMEIHFPIIELKTRGA